MTINEVLKQEPTPKFVRRAGWKDKAVMLVDDDSPRLVRFHKASQNWRVGYWCPHLEHLTTADWEPCQDPRIERAA